MQDISCNVTKQVTFPDWSEVRGEQTRTIGVRVSSKSMSSPGFHQSCCDSTLSLMSSCLLSVGAADRFKCFWFVSQCDSHHQTMRWTGRKGCCSTDTLPTHLREEKRGAQPQILDRQTDQGSTCYSISSSCKHTQALTPLQRNTHRSIGFHYISWSLNWARNSAFPAVFQMQ